MCKTITERDSYRLPQRLGYLHSKREKDQRSPGTQVSHYTRAPEASCLPAVVIPRMCLDSCLDREPVFPRYQWGRDNRMALKNKYNKKINKNSALKK
ncbi:unnamed protein product [Arctogadus glacialis]